MFCHPNDIPLARIFSRDDIYIPLTHFLCFGQVNVSLVVVASWAFSLLSISNVLMKLLFPIPVVILVPCFVNRVRCANFNVIHFFCLSVLIFHAWNIYSRNASLMRFRESRFALLRWRTYIIFWSHHDSEDSILYWLIEMKNRQKILWLVSINQFNGRFLLWLEQDFYFNVFVCLSRKLGGHWRKFIIRRVQLY